MNPTTNPRPARRLVTDAKIVLRNAGYTVTEYRTALKVTEPGNVFTATLSIFRGTVDSNKVDEILKNGVNEE